MWFFPLTPIPLSLLESLPKIKSNISSALSKCLPSFDRACRPPLFSLPTPYPLRLGGCEMHISIIKLFPFKVRHLRVENLLQSS